MCVFVDTSCVCIVCDLIPLLLSSRFTLVLSQRFHLPRFFAVCLQKCPPNHILFPVTDPPGDMVYLFSPCPRPPPPVPAADADSNYCSTIPVDSDSFGLEVAPSSPVLDAKCIQGFTTAPVATAMLEVSLTAPEPAVIGGTFGARLEKALQHAQMVQWAVEPENGIAEVEEFEVVDLSQSQPTAPRSSRRVAGEPSATQLRRRTRSQSGLQRHNAGDNQPILLRKPPEDRKNEKVHSKSVLRKWGTSIVHLFCMIFLIRTAAEHAHEGPPSRNSRKSKVCG